jgi:Protein of unknown function (DUF3047)
MIDPRDRPLRLTFEPSRPSGARRSRLGFGAAWGRADDARDATVTRWGRLLPLWFLLLPLAATAAVGDMVVVEDWSRLAVGVTGIPQGWTGQNWGSPVFDMTVVESEGQKALHLRSRGEGSTILKDIKGKVTLKETPILEWRWKAVTLPRGGDSRRKDADDQAAQVYVVWQRFPELVRSRIIGYVWDTTAPAGTIVKSEKTRTVTYVIVRSGAGDLGKWVTESRNVAEDFRKIYGETPDDPDGVSIAIDSNDTRSEAESFVGQIAFRRP